MCRTCSRTCWEIPSRGCWKPKWMKNSAIPSNDYKNKETDDSRNGYSRKAVPFSIGEIDFDIPRDRKGEFEPQAVKKNQTDIHCLPA